MVHSLQQVVKIISLIYWNVSNVHFDLHCLYTAHIAVSSVCLNIYIYKYKLSLNAAVLFATTVLLLVLLLSCKSFCSLLSVTVIIKTVDLCFCNVPFVPLVSALQESPWSSVQVPSGQWDDDVPYEGKIIFAHLTHSGTQALCIYWHCQYYLLRMIQYVYVAGFRGRGV